jgi:hypothetical protein
MRHTAWLLAALLGGGLLINSPSEAQVRFGVGPNGPSVQIGPDRDRYVERYRYRDDLVTGSVNDCRTVTKRVQRPNGTVVITRERRC